jgi:hypothetical protein
MKTTIVKLLRVRVPARTVTAATFFYLTIDALFLLVDFSTDTTSGFHHILQCLNGFRPCAGLETAVGVDHETLRGQALQKALNLFRNELDGGNDRGVNVIRSRAQTLVVTNFLEGHQGRVVAAGVLNRVHVGVEFVNGIHAVMELAVTHVRVDLRFAFCMRRGQAEGVHRPFEILLFGHGTQGHGFAQRGFVHLNALWWKEGHATNETAEENPVIALQKEIQEVLPCIRHSPDP